MEESGSPHPSLLAPDILGGNYKRLNELMNDQLSELGPYDTTKLVKQVLLLTSAWWGDSNKVLNTDLELHVIENMLKDPRIKAIVEEAQQTKDYRGILTCGSFLYSKHERHT